MVEEQNYGRIFGGKEDKIIISLTNDMTISDTVADKNCQIIDFSRFLHFSRNYPTGFPTPIDAETMAATFPVLQEQERG